MPILEEVDSIGSLEELEDPGLIPIEPEIEDVFTAQEMDGQTSFQDNICFLTARRQRFTCVSNDTHLRRHCSHASIPTLWGLELILLLTKVGGIWKKEAFRIAKGAYTGICSSPLCLFVTSGIYEKIILSGGNRHYSPKSGRVVYG